MRARIIDCAAAMFSRYGIKGITMDMLAGELHISKRTLYEYFNCKQELLDDCLQQRLTQIGLLRVSEQELIDELLKLHKCLCKLDLEDVWSFCNDLKKQYAGLYQSLVGQLFDYAFRCGQMIPDGIDNGMIRRDVQPSIISSTIGGYLTRLFFDSGSDSRVIRKVLNPETVLIFTRGIVTIKGRAYLDRKLKELDKKQCN